MRSEIIVDAGPLIALFDKDDQHHKRVCAWYQERHFRGHTTLAVVTEVSYSLAGQLAAQLDFLRWVRSRALRIVNLSDGNWQRVIEVMQKYKDLPADFADATLVAVAERLKVRDVLTLDSDFRIYRYLNRHRFSLPLLDI